jgi:hypothetical protein
MEEAYYKLLNDTLAGYNRVTPDRIVSLRNNQIFVFGTDTKGSQRSGAAGIAARSFGAQIGVVDGPTGKCYALPTMGFSIDELVHAVARFEQYVRENMRYTYLVTPIGCGHAGFDVSAVAKLFKGLVGLQNVMLPELFLKQYREECHNYFSCQQSVEKQEGNLIGDNEDDILLYFDEHLHDVVKYLVEHKIPFDKEGGFTICDEDGNIIAEAELGIESERVVFSPFNSQSEIAFKNNGYSVFKPADYLKLKQA